MTEPTLSGDDPGGYRTLLGAFATGITVLTTQSDGEPIGMTASAVSAVSLDPPLLLVCINQKGRMHSVLTNGKPFALSILAEDQEEISTRFASAENPFTDTRVTDHGDRLLLIDNAAAHIICEVWGAHTAGDHTVFFGRVYRGDVYDRRPLLHHRSRYTTTRD